MSVLAPTLQAFFTDRLIRQRQASSHTLASYRDTMRLLVRFAAERRKVEPVKLEISDLDSALISTFLDHRERDCGNSVRTRNTRLTAIRSLFRYAALRHPEHAASRAREGPERRGDEASRGPAAARSTAIPRASRPAGRRRGEDRGKK